MKRISRHEIELAVLLAGVVVVLMVAGCQGVFSDSGIPARKAPEAATLVLEPADEPLNSTEASAIVEPPSAPILPVAEMPAPVAAFEAVPPSSSIGPSAAIAVPILYYHAFGTPPSNEMAPEIYVRTEEFVAQLRYLQSAGYHAVTLQQVYDCWSGQGTLPENPIVISIDDGFESDFTIAAPLLKSMGWPACLALIAGETPGTTSMDVAQVRALVEAGWEIDAHTIHHVDLTKVSSEQLTREVAESRRRLQEMFGVPVNFFCYPYGKFDTRVETAVRAAGYLGATSIQFGFAKSIEPYKLKRIWVGRGESISTFAASLK
ncbi:MAG: polysaccharide deacetylase family protein [Coriobacteriia bacterium]|nr:polysaccharide deacetylase family protein [Coriobacteriia bacterium]